MTAMKFQLLHKKMKFFLALVLSASLVFIAYQVVMFVQLQNAVRSQIAPNFVRGVHDHRLYFYSPNELGQFVCIHSLEVIEHRRINDDYCDCSDGSDEPGTDACPNGEFYCSFQGSYGKYPRRLPSNRVNDGICDCCDGSDEWGGREVPFRLDANVQELLKRYFVPCPKLCS